MALYTQTGNQFSTAKAIGQMADAQSAANSSGRQMLQALTGLGQAAEQAVGSQFERLMKAEADASIIDAAKKGALNVKPNQLAADLVEGDSAWAQSYNKTQRQLTRNNIGSFVGGEIQKLAIEYKTDPEGFKNAVSGLHEKLLEDNKDAIGGDEEAKSVFNEYTLTESARYYPSIERDAYAQQKEIQYSDQRDFLEKTGNKALGAARISGNKTTFIDNDMVVQKQVIDDAIEIGAITPEQGRRLLNDFYEEGVSQLGWFENDQYIKAGNPNGADAAADSWFKEQLESGEIHPDKAESEYLRMKATASNLRSKQQAEANRRKKENEKAEKAQLQSDTYDQMVSTGQTDPDNPIIKAESEKRFADTFGTAPNYDDPSVRSQIMEYVSTTQPGGRIPDSMSNYFSSVQFTNDPVRMENASQMFNGIKQSNPMTAAKVSDKDTILMNNYSGFRAAGMDEQKAFEVTQNVMSMSDADRRKSVFSDSSWGGTGKNQAGFDKKVDSAVRSWINDVSPSWFGEQKEITAADRRTLTARYSQLMLANSANYTTFSAAKKATEETISNSFGVSYVTGKPQIMENPPESILGTREYSEDNQVAMAFKAEVDPIIKGLPADVTKGKDVRLRNTGMTNSNGQPRYQLILSDSKGNTENVYKDGKIITWSYDAQSQKTVVDAAAKMKQEAVDKAKAKREKARSQREMAARSAEAAASSRGIGYHSYTTAK